MLIKKWYLTFFQVYLYACIKNMFSKIVKDSWKSDVSWLSQVKKVISNATEIIKFPCHLLAVVNIEVFNHGYFKSCFQLKHFFFPFGLNTAHINLLKYIVF